MKKIFFTALAIFNLLFALSAHAEVKDDTTTVVLRKTIIVNGPINEGTGNHAPIFIPTVYASLVSEYIYIDTGYFTEEYITLTISDETDEIIYINETVQNTGFVTQIDISSLPSGTYTISIIDGDDEYVGEFEVF